MYPSPLCLSRAFFLTSTTSQMKVSNKQPTRFIFTSLLQCWRCSHLSRCEGARSPHFLDCDAPGSAAVRPGFCAGRTGGAGCASHCCVRPDSDATFSRSPQKNNISPYARHTPRFRTTPRGRSGGHRPPVSLHQWAGAPCPAS